MKKLLALAFVTTLGMGVLSGCSKLEEKKSAAPTPAAPTAAPSAAPAPTAAPAPAADAGKIGVAECDDYMEKVKKCID
ncbi:MAG: hypothetical protein JNK65_04070, partial [Deltaproteobacteria bacterium]|nr:hypothetical protein [Deltaproteobacteria bacterium]